MIHFRENLLFAALTLLLIQTSTRGQSSFPLETGNQWSYQISSSGQLSTGAIEVVGDTLFSNGKIYWVLNGPGTTGFDATLGRYVRVDSQFVHFYDEIIAQERPVYKLNATVGESWSISWGPYTQVTLASLDSITIFGESSTRWYFVLDGLAISHLSLLEDFGPGYIGQLGDPPVSPPEYSQSLTGCILSGVQYGTVVGVSSEAEIKPDDFQLYQNYPNPFNPSTTIEYSLPVQSQVSLKVYDTLGRGIITLVDEYQAAGAHSKVWNGKNLYGEAAASGVYFFTLVSNKIVMTRKMLLLR